MSAPAEGNTITWMFFHNPIAFLPGVLYLSISIPQRRKKKENTVAPPTLGIASNEAPTEGLWGAGGGHQWTPAF